MLPAVLLINKSLSLSLFKMLKESYIYIYFILEGKKCWYPAPSLHLQSTSTFLTDAVIRACQGKSLVCSVKIVSLRGSKTAP